MSYTFESPFQYIPKPEKFGAVGLGKLYIGVINGNPASTPADRIQAYIARQGLSDLAISQPIDISAGGVPIYQGAPVTIKVNSAYSCTVLDHLGAQVYYSPSSGDEITEFTSIDLRLDYLESNSVQTVETWESISTVTPNAAGQLFSLAQHTSGGIGGGTLMALVGSVTDDGGTQKNCLGGFYLKRVGSDSSAYASWFGCVLDCTQAGVGTDDTANMQKAIDYCVPQPASLPARKLYVDGPAKITSQLFIDRTVDTTVNLFVIEGAGKSSGFIQTTGFTLFGSRLPYGPSAGPYTKTPITEFTSFHNIGFTNTIGSSTGFVFDEKYLRISFFNCRFRGIRAALGTDYFQSVKFHNCHIRGNNGYFLQNNDSYDIRVLDACEFESSGAGFNFTGILRGASFSDFLFQNCTAPFLNCYNGFGVSVNEPYFEANTGQVVTFGAGGSDGVSLKGGFYAGTGAQEADVNFYMVSFGAARRGEITGINTACNLADNSSAPPFAIVTSGCGVPSNRKILKNSISSSPSVVPNVAGTQALATQITSYYNYIPVNGTVNASVIMPTTILVPDVGGITIFNDGSNAIRVYPAVGQRFQGLAANVPITIATGASKRLINGLDDSWIIL